MLVLPYITNKYFSSVLVAIFISLMQNNSKYWNELENTSIFPRLEFIYSINKKNRKSTKFEKMRGNFLNFAKNGTGVRNFVNKWNRESINVSGNIEISAENLCPCQRREFYFSQKKISTFSYHYKYLFLKSIFSSVQLSLERH